MTPTDLIGLTEAKELIQTKQYRQALVRLNNLLQQYPNDPEIHALIRMAERGDNFNDAPTPPPPARPSQIRIRVESVSIGGFLSIFFAVFCALMLAWFVIFFLLGFHFEYTPLR